MILYRPYQSQDKPGVFSLIRKSHNSRFFHYKNPSFPVYSIKRRFFDTGGCFWVAIDDKTNQIVGTLGVILKNGKVAKLKALRVSASHRRQGIASSLLAMAQEFAKSKGYQEVYLTVHQNNRVARRAYLKAGYQFTEPGTASLRLPMVKRL